LSIVINGRRYESVKDGFEEEFGIPYEQASPEWNINYYTKLLKITKKTVRRKKLQNELDWWIETKNELDKYDFQKIKPEMLYTTKESSEKTYKTLDNIN
jgi:hypothetical protein